MRESHDQSRSLLAAHIRSMRKQRGLSLDDLAVRSGVSRATLSRIENDEVSPTAETLGQLATAFAMPISQLIAPMERSFQALVRRETQSVWRDEQNGFVRRNVSPPSARLGLELIEAELGPQRSIAYAAPAVPGHEHHVMLLEGALAVTVEDTKYDLGPGDCLRYQLFGPSRFETGPSPARYIIALC
jgi:transcriptional regulator with XRE-family HTH domain